MNLKKEIEMLVSNGQFDKAIEKLQNIEFNNKKLKNDIIALKARYTNWNENYHSGRDNDGKEFNKIVQSILYYVGRFDGLKESKKDFSEGKQNKNYISKFLFLLIPLLLSIIILGFYHQRIKNELKEKNYIIDKDKSYLELELSKCQERLDSVSLKSCEYISHWEFKIDSTSNLYNFKIRSRCFKNLNIQNKRLLFGIYKVDSQSNYKIQTDVTISGFKEIPNPNGDDKDYQIPCPNNPKVQEGENVVITMYLVPSSLNLDYIQTIGDIEDKGGILLKWRQTKAIK